MDKFLMDTHHLLQRASKIPQIGGMRQKDYRSAGMYLLLCLIMVRPMLSFGGCSLLIKRYPLPFEPILKQQP